MEWVSLGAIAISVIALTLDAINNYRLRRALMGYNIRDHILWIQDCDRAWHELTKHESVAWRQNNGLPVIRSSELKDAGKSPQEAAEIIFSEVGGGNSGTSF